MGAGKTSLARRIARDLGLTSVDADTFFSRRIGMPAGAFIAEYGEAAFREQETAVLTELLDREPAFISCGGGIVERPENLEVLRSRFVVYLRTTADESRQRITNMKNRPLFGDIEAARELAGRRAPLYEAVADVTIDTAGLSVAALAAKVGPVLVERGVVCRRQE
ncbi:MAG: shikimate kinase [Eggerthellaceae bacterium]|nr:shikimate kinase [Eggerthellaceae bacterium]